jgi:hypothetical protein
MNVSPTRNARILVTTLLLAGVLPGARGQDATPPAGQSVNSSTSSSTAPTQGSQTQATGSDKSKPVCFPLTGRCVEPGKPPATKDPSSARAGQTGSGGKKALNLTAPDVRTVVPAEELKEPLPSGEEVTEVQEENTVAVKSEKDTPDVPGGFGALWWALNHPSQAWRIVTPAE